MKQRPLSQLERQVLAVACERSTLFHRDDLFAAWPTRPVPATEIRAAMQVLLFRDLIEPARYHRRGTFRITEAGRQEVRVCVA